MIKTFKKEKTLKNYLLKNSNFKSLNGIPKQSLNFLEVTNTHATYYSVEKQEFLLLYAPFTLEV